MYLHLSYYSVLVTYFRFVRLFVNTNKALVYLEHGYFNKSRISYLNILSRILNISVYKICSQNNCTCITLKNALMYTYLYKHIKRKKNYKSWHTYIPFKRHNTKLLLKDLTGNPWITYKMLAKGTIKIIKKKYCKNKNRITFNDMLKICF